MAIRSISRWEFDGLLRWRRILESFTGWHVEWFANDAGTLIGVVYEGRGDADWSHVILERDDRGTFRVCAQKIGVASQEEARTQLLRTMNASEQSQRQVPTETR
jgi:hypothetical protein